MGSSRSGGGGCGSFWEIPEDGNCCIPFANESILVQLCAGDIGLEPGRNW